MTAPLSVKDPARQLRRWFFAALLLAGLGVLILVGSGLAWRWRLSKEIDSRVAVIRAEGLPVDWTDLETWPGKVADKDNAALLYGKAFEGFNECGTNFEGIVLPNPAQALPAETLAVMARIVATNAAVLAAVHRITNASNSRYPIDYQDGPIPKLPHLARLHDLALVLGWEAVLKAQSGDSSGAVEAVEATMNLSQSLDQEPILSSQLSSATILAIASDSLERILCRTSLSDEQLSRLAAQLSAAEAMNRFRIGLIGDRALFGEFIRLLHSDPQTPVEESHQGSEEEEQTPAPAGKPGIGWRLIGFYERDRNFFLRAMQTNIQVVSIGPPASLALTNEVERLADQAKSGFYMVSSMALPSYTYLARRDAGIRAQVRTALTAVAIERWRNANSGRIPQTLADLVPSLLPAIPVDPFDGKPLRLKRLAKGYVVYSIGSDFQDNEGKEPPPWWPPVPKEKREHYDITFTVDR